MRKWLIAMFLLGAASSLQADHGYAGFYNESNACYAQRGNYRSGTNYMRPTFYSDYNSYPSYSQGMGGGYYYQTDSFADQQMRMNQQTMDTHPGMMMHSAPAVNSMRTMSPGR